ncbi:MAG: DUF1906 domain-containing protein, partial [Solirubrobacterales bacterium]|nr:DUF1906 domain-containing protein [Solirubrobacterales bacterium]
PAHAAGRTEAILVEPLTAHGAGAAAGAAGPVLPGAPGAGGAGGPSPPGAGGQGSLAQLLAPAQGLAVTATWSSSPQTVARALGVRSLASSPASARAAQAPPPARARAASGASVYTGLGFDACSAPSPADMAAWSSSPYRAIGIYIGGTNMACSQPNLTAGWTSGETAAGWHLIPTYVGLQAPTNSCGCASIVPSQASAQGAAAASDAVTHAQALGLGPGSPIYDDMEAYSTGSPNTAAVLNFLSAWTAGLHAAGYSSGVYGNANSAISDMIAARGTGFQEPDDIWIADWNGEHTTSDPYVPSSDWSAHQRLHQYSGGANETHGGVTLNIDGDYLDGATVGATSIPDGTFVQVAGQPAVWLIAGGAPLYVSSWSPFGGPQPYTIISAQQFSSLNPYPANGTFLATSTRGVFRVVGGAPFGIRSWSLYGVVLPSITIDPWNILNISNPAAHLRTAPVDGTVVQGLPSHRFWVFYGGRREPSLPSTRAFSVDDATLAIFPLITCVVPNLRHLTVAQARAALNQAHCELGKTHRPRRAPAHRTLHVVGQSPRARSTHAANHRVAITLG